jgi:hypothetical protein
MPVVSKQPLFAVHSKVHPDPDSKRLTRANLMRRKSSIMYPNVDEYIAF